MKFKATAILLSIILFLSGCEPQPKQPVSTHLDPPKINAQAVALVDWDSGRLLYGHNHEKQIPMASTTKIMTAIVAIEQGNLNDIVTVSRNAADTWGSDIDLRTGNKLTLEELLYGLLLKSGNDAAVAIAEHIGGSVEGFAELMNNKVQELGLKNTHFVTPHGLDTDGHYTTALDLAKITRYAMNNKIFQKMVSTKSKEITNRSLSNTNELLYSLEGADGVKTGYTGLAGRCLVASATRNDQRLIAVALGCPTKTARGQTCANLIEFGFKNYSPELLFKKNQEIKKIKVNKGTVPYISLTTKDQRVQLPLTQSEKAELSLSIDTPDSVTAPINEGQLLGKLTVKINEEEITSYQLYAQNASVNKKYGDFLHDIIDEVLNLFK